MGNQSNRLSPRTPKHVGIASITAEGGAICYREIVHFAESVLGPHHHPEISLHTLPFHLFTDALDSKNEVWCDLMVASSRKLALAGAEFFVCPANTNHLVYEQCRNNVAIPWLHIAEVASRHASLSGCKRALLLGTKPLVESTVYPDYFAPVGVEVVIPGADERTWIHECIYSELVAGIVRGEIRERFRELISHYVTKERCDSVILGCTELPLIIDSELTDVKLVDSTRVLAHGAVAASLRVELVDVYADIAKG